MMYYLKNPFIFAAWKTKNYRNMLQSLKNQAIFANPMTLRFSMETITLSYEPGSDFAVALEKLIRNSEGVRVERSLWVLKSFGIPRQVLTSTRRLTMCVNN